MILSHVFFGLLITLDITVIYLDVKSLKKVHENKK